MAAHNSAEMILCHVIKLENAKQNPLVPGATRSAGYFAMLEERRMLPMMQAESFNSFLKLYSTQQVVTVTAGTASGKSTQLTQRIMYLELDKGLQVVCTQPRRVAARRIAEGVAAEMDVRLGDQVGIHHGDYNNTNETTRLKFVAEGILLRQYQEDPTLSHYVGYGGIEIQEGYNPRVGMKTLLPAAISKASAEQRAGRANRTQSGSSPPSILRTDIKKYILILKSAGFKGVGRFDFLEPPHPEVYLRGLQVFKAINGSITPAGNGSLQLSIEQAWYDALVEGLKLGCLDEMISIAALCSTRHSIFAKPHPQQYAAAIEHAEFCNPISDHMTELDAFYKWQQQCKLGEKEAAIWCHEKFLDVEALNEALKLRKELLVKCYELFGVKSVPMLKFDYEEYDMKIRKATLGGFYHHTTTVDDPAKDQYKTLDNYPVGIHPDSSLVGMGWKFIVYNEIGFTSHAYMGRCTVVELDWLLDIDYFNTENLPQDYNSRLRNKKVREILANFDRRPEQPTAQRP